MFIWGLHVYAWKRSVLWERRSRATKMAFPMEVSNVSYNSSCNKDEVWLHLENVYTWGTGGCGDWWRTLLLSFMLLHSHALKVDSTVLVWFGMCVCGIIFLRMNVEMIPSFYQIASWHVSPTGQAESFQTSKSEEEFWFLWKWTTV